MSSQYITVRETAQILAVSEKKVMDLIESGNLQAYKIADQFLRLKRNEVVNMLSTGQVVSENVSHSYTPGNVCVIFFILMIFIWYPWSLSESCFISFSLPINGSNPLEGGGRVVECGGLENRCLARGREFQSHPLRFLI